MKKKEITRKDFLKISTAAAAGGILIPNFLISQDCELTTTDITGPYYDENAPYRTFLASPEEPGTPITISGKIYGNDCETPLPNTLVEVWHANNDGCYSIFQMCDTGNPEDDQFHLRGKMLTNEDGYFEFHTIQPGHYLSRPKHFHIKFTTVDGHTLITQIYFSGDPFIETDPWASEAGNRIIPLIETESGLVGNIDVNLDSETFNTIPGDVNFDGQLDILDILEVINYILGINVFSDQQLYSADLNQDGVVNIVDIISLVNIILGQSSKNFISPNLVQFKIEQDKISLNSTKPIAGIQFEFSGNFIPKDIKLNDGWEYHYHNKRLIIVNLSNPKLKNPSTIFKFSGKISIVSVLVSDWNGRLVQTEIGNELTNFSIENIYPNPFNSTTNIRFYVKNISKIEISIFNIRGKFIETVFNEYLVEGYQQIIWKPKNIPSGLYFIKFKSNHESHHRQILYLK